MSDAHDANADLDMADVYAAGSSVEANRIALMLEDEGIEVMSREISVSEFPSLATQRFLLLTPASEKERAQGLIRGAIADGVLPAEGTFL